MSSARSVKHYVSDCLSERHPYDVQKGFAGRPARDAGKVYDGYALTGGLESLINSLTDTAVGDAERIHAVRYLYGHSSSQEKKLELVQRGVVASVVSVLAREPLSALEHQCFLLLWSLCVLPQGCYPVARCGGLEAATHAVSRTGTDGEGRDRAQARVAAASVIAQLSSNFAGLRWMMQAEDCTEFVLPGVEYPPGAVQPPPSAAAAPSPASLLACLTEAVRSEPLGVSKVALHCATALANITAIAPGVHLVSASMEALAAGSGEGGLIPVLVQQLRAYAQRVAAMPAWTAAGPLPMSPELAYLTQMLTTVWNIALDQTGVELLDAVEAPSALFDLFLLVKEAGVARVPSLVQRTLTGALSAVSKLTSVKLASVQTVSGAGMGEPAEATRVHALLYYLRDVNRLVDAATVQQQQPSADLVAISKNTVQCLRLASEVKAVRDLTHAFLAKLGEGEAKSTEGFYFRRQLYTGTQWEAEYGATVPR